MQNERHLKIKRTVKDYRAAELLLREALQNGEGIEEAIELLKEANIERVDAVKLPDKRACAFCKEEFLWEDKKLVMLHIGGLTQFVEVYDETEDSVQHKIKSPEFHPNIRPSFDACKKCLVTIGLEHLIDDRTQEIVEQRKKIAISGVVNVLANAVIADKFEDKE